MMPPSNFYAHNAWTLYNTYENLANIFLCLYALIHAVYMYISLFHVLIIIQISFLYQVIQEEEERPKEDPANAAFRFLSTFV